MTVSVIHTALAIFKTSSALFKTTHPPATRVHVVVVFLAVHTKRNSILRSPIPLNDAQIKEVVHPDHKRGIFGDGSAPWPTHAEDDQLHPPPGEAAKDDPQLKLERCLDQRGSSGLDRIDSEIQPFFLHRRFDLAPNRRIADLVEELVTFPS